MDEFEILFHHKGQPGLGRFRDPAKNPGLGPGRKIRKSGIRDQEWDSKLKNPGSETGTGTQICSTRDSGTQLWGTVPGTKDSYGVL